MQHREANLPAFIARRETSAARQAAMTRPRAYGL